jgi:hypothetical protein
MAEYTSRNVTTVRREYALRKPTNRVEVEKVFAALDQELKQLGIGWSDDLITVDATDEEIVFWYEKSTEVTHG